MFTIPAFTPSRTPKPRFFASKNYGTPEQRKNIITSLIGITKQIQLHPLADEQVTNDLNHLIQHWQNIDGKNPGFKAIAVNGGIDTSMRTLIDSISEYIAQQADRIKQTITADMINALPGDLFHSQTKKALKTNIHQELSEFMNATKIRLKKDLGIEVHTLEINRLSAILDLLHPVTDMG